MNTEAKLSTSQKVELALKEQRRTKKWLADEFGVVYETIYYKLKENNWSVAELLLLQKLLNID